MLTHRSLSGKIGDGTLILPCSITKHLWAITRFHHHRLQYHNLIIIEILSLEILAGNNILQQLGLLTLSLKSFFFYLESCEPRSPTQKLPKYIGVPDPYCAFCNEIESTMYIFWSCNRYNFSWEWVLSFFAPYISIFLATCPFWGFVHPHFTLMGCMANFSYYFVIPHLEI